VRAARSRSGPPLAKFLARRLLVIAGIVFILNSVAVGLYYGSDRRALEAEAAAAQVERLQEAIEGAALPREAPVRRLYAEHPDAYAFALVDRGGVVIDAMNPHLIPPGATDLYADDWITRLDPDREGTPLVVAGHEFAGRQDGLRMVFVMAGDPARLLWRAYLGEFYKHVWLPILPLVLLLISANTLLIRRGLAPISAAAEWARALRPGAPTPPPDVRVPEEIADLVEATERSVGRLAQALQAEKRHAAEAAHALRTPVAVLVARVDALPPGETTDRLRADLSALSRTVQQVLASSRAEALPPAEEAGLDLRAPPETVTAALAPFAYERGVELELDLPETPVMALATAEGVELALTNHVENAILHGGAGRVGISVGPGPVVTVRDHGPGLPEGAEGRLFDPFWRGRGAAQGGTGLGLAIVARVLRAQGGSVAARNAPGGGAEFVLTWPPATS
jgi:two-component system OmpR family sensor kinase